MKHTLCCLLLILNVMPCFSQEAKPLTKQEAVEAYKEYRIGVKKILSVQQEILGASFANDGGKKIEIPEHRVADYKAARKHLEKSASLNPYFPEVYVFLANSYWELENDLEKTVEYYSKALDLDPDYDDVISARGYVYTLQGKRDLAMRDLKKLEELKSPHVDGLKDEIKHMENGAK